MRLAPRGLPGMAAGAQRTGELGWGTRTQPSGAPTLLQGRPPAHRCLCCVWLRPWGRRGGGFGCPFAENAGGSNVAGQLCRLVNRKKQVCVDRPEGLSSHAPRATWASRHMRLAPHAPRAARGATYHGLSASPLEFLVLPLHMLNHVDSEDHLQLGKGAGEELLLAEAWNVAKLIAEGLGRRSGEGG